MALGKIIRREAMSCNRSDHCQPIDRAFLPCFMACDEPVACGAYLSKFSKATVGGSHLVLTERRRGAQVGLANADSRMFSIKCRHTRRFT